MITISDDGIGGVGEKENSFGITGVIERLGLINAELKIYSNHGGTTIQIKF